MKAVRENSLHIMEMILKAARHKRKKSKKHNQQSQGLSNKKIKTIRTARLKNHSLPMSKKMKQTWMIRLKIRSPLTKMLDPSRTSASLRFVASF